MPTQNTYLPEDVIKYLKARAKEEGRSFSNLLALIVRQEMTRDKRR